jgi:hypothetical protein
MAKHTPSIVWPLRSITYRSYVRTESENSLALTIMDPGGYEARTVSISRKDARLLAKRINQCLDDTTAKGKYGGK